MPRYPPGFELRAPALLTVVLLLSVAAEDQPLAAADTELSIVNCNLRVELADLKASQAAAETARLEGEVATFRTFKLGAERDLVEVGRAKVAAETEVTRLTLENAALRLEQRLAEDEVARLKRGRDDLGEQVAALRSEVFEELRTTKVDLQTQVERGTHLLKVAINQTQEALEARMSDHIEEANKTNSELQQTLQKYKEEGGMLLDQLAVQLTYLNTTLQPVIKGLLKIAAMNLVQLGDKQYYISSDAVPWADARHFCLQHHLDLLAIETREENELIVTYLSGTLRNNADYWSAGRAGPSGLFSWASSGQAFGFADWYTGHYERSLAAGKCMVVYSRELQRKWEVRTCSTGFRFICETVW